MSNTKKTPASTMGAGSVLSTVSVPSSAPPPTSLGGVPQEAALLDKAAGAQDAAAGMPFNSSKPGEHGDAARTPQAGQTCPMAHLFGGASTTGETTASPKVGAGVPPQGVNPASDTLDRVRVDATGQRLTTNQGVPVADNQNSLKVGLRGPTAMEDFILREKITHFDHERIPERVVHARGSAAHGYFESYGDLSQLTRAVPFAGAGKRTPVFVRFSTVAGERGSADTVRDVRGFAVKFYTEEGNWDLVGNNMPVFFIQDAMKFPDLIHAVKPEPHNGIPQAASAHDTFWDFVTLMPESTHMLMWHLSDRAIPRSYRTMQGFGVHTFRLVNAQGESVFCKFHWNPVGGTHSLVWDEAAKICGADADFHRRDLWEAIEAGNYPEWELGIQVFTEEQAEQFPFDVLDATKIVPEELVPVQTIGKMVLNRNPDNFFAETEQVAFCTAHIVPGIDFSNDPLLQGRIHSYLDTQISRLGGVNFHEIPVNAPVAQVHNNQRDGMHRQAIHRGRVSYEPNSLGGGCPFQAGMAGFTTAFSSLQQKPEDKVRGKPELFADHYSQARLFWISQTPSEQAHIVNAYRFELSRVTVPAIRVRLLSMLANVDPLLAEGVAAGLGLEVPPPMPLATEAPQPHYEPSPALSLLARAGSVGVKGRKVAILASHGVNGASLQAVYDDLLKAGAVPRLVGPYLGQLKTQEGAMVDVEISMEAAPAVLYDALVIADGDASAKALQGEALALDFVRQQYNHCKPILAIGAAQALLDRVGLPAKLPSGQADPSLWVTDSLGLKQALDEFKGALAAHRNFQRESEGSML
ncbi:MAG: catalase [Duganella sp.]